MTTPSLLSRGGAFFDPRGDHAANIEPARKRGAGNEEKGRDEKRGQIKSGEGSPVNAFGMSLELEGGLHFHSCSIYSLEARLGSALTPSVFLLNGPKSTTEGSKSVGPDVVQRWHTDLSTSPSSKECTFQVLMATRAQPAFAQNILPKRPQYAVASKNRTFSPSTLDTRVHPCCSRSFGQLSQ